MHGYTAARSTGPWVPILLQNLSKIFQISTDSNNFIGAHMYVSLSSVVCANCL